MFSLKTAFGRAAKRSYGPSTFWLLLFAIIIIDDEQREEIQRRKKRERPTDPRAF